MAVRMGKENRGATAKTLAALQQAAGAPLPEDYVAFLRRTDGGRPEGNRFDVGAAQGASVDGFLRAADVGKRAAALADRLPPGALPVADASGGNLVLLKPSPDGWRVAFWDHEEERATEIAASFQVFVDGLEPFGPEDVPEPDVVSAWIDPELLKNQK